MIASVSRGSLISPDGLEGYRCPAKIANFCEILTAPPATTRYNTKLFLAETKRILNYIKLILTEFRDRSPVPGAQFEGSLLSACKVVYCMEPIFHLVTPSLWEQTSADDFAPDSLTWEGFIHCSFATQVEWAANKFYPQAKKLSLLEIDPDRLTSPVKVEPPSPDSNSGKLFPHIYGPIQRIAVRAVHELRRDDQGRWVFENT